MHPLVSVIVPTKNSEEFLEACLKSIKSQTYKDIEIVIVDNNSIDGTKKVAKRYTSKVFTKGPERSAQRNFGAVRSRGEFLLFIDSDMELSKNLVKDCVERINGFKALIIPERSVGKGFWADCKALERSFYSGVDWIEAPRFIEREAFENVGRWDETLISGEDWDLNNRIREIYKVGRVSSFIYHNEGKLKLLSLLRKKYYYSKKIKDYSKKSPNSFSNQSNPVRRYVLFFSNPVKLFKNPIVGVGMLFMKTFEFIVGAAGILAG